jgi:hypothetical protein
MAWIPGPGRRLPEPYMALKDAETEIREAESWQLVAQALMEDLRDLLDDDAPSLDRYAERLKVEHRFAAARAVWLRHLESVRS